jgi:hypothetical protein
VQIAPNIKNHLSLNGTLCFLSFHGRFSWISYPFKRNDMKEIILSVGLALMSSISFGQVMSKDMWIVQMKTVLPQHLCSSEQYFRQCFNLQESQCRMVAADATNACLKQYEGRIPAILKQPADGTYWGQQVGMCAGNLYEVLLVQLKQKINTAKCNNPNNWR